MEEKLTWVSLSYTLPLAPSGSRVYIWRKLRELGAGALRQGAAVLPEGKQNLQKLLELATKIRQLGGEATVVQLRFVEEQDCQRMVESFRRQSAREYQALLEETAQLYQLSTQPPDRARQKAIQRRYQKVRNRDFFGAQELLDSEDIASGLLQNLGLDLDGGWGELMAELKGGLAQLTQAMTGRDDQKEG